MFTSLPRSPSASFVADSSDRSSQATVIDTPHYPSLDNISIAIKHPSSQSQSISHSKAISVSSQFDTFDSEIQALRQEVSRAERDKSLLTDYAIELQSRIQKLEQARMNTQSVVDTNTTLSPSNSRPPIKASPSSSTLKPSLTHLSSVPLASKQSLSLTPSTATSSNQISSPSPMHNKQPNPGSKPKLLPKRVVRQSKGLETGKSPSTLCRPMSPSRPSMATTSTAKSKNIEKTTLPSKPSNVSKLPMPDSRYDRRTLFSSKLDPLVLTSKLLPMSPRNKATAKPPEPSKVSIPPPRTITNASRNGGAVILDSPPSKGTIKPRHIIKIKQELPNSIKVAKDAKDEKSTIDGKKSNLHVSFSNSVDELIVSKTDGPTGEREAVESTNKLWGSWNKKRLSFQVPTIHEDPDKSSSTPSMNSLADDGKRKEKHRSLAPQYLKSLISGSNESMSEASHVALRRSNSMSGCPTPSRPSGSSNLLPDPSSSSSTKKRLSPLLVGSPTLPKARLETEAGVERVNSLGSSGKWASRSRILSVDLTRRRTIHPAHPLFSFERPGSAGAASIRNEKPGSVKDEELGDIKKQRRATMPATKPTECFVPGSKSNETTNVDGLARSDPTVSLPKGPLLRPLLGGQTLGRFDFEASTSTSILPRRVERNARLSSATALTKFTSSTCRLSKLGISESPDAPTSMNPESNDKRFHEYTQFCLDLRAILNDDDWSSFMNYARRFDLHILTPDVLLQRVKKLIDGRRNVDPTKRDKLYERFSRIVHDSIRD